MTREQKLLALINYCIANPYILRPRKLATKFKLTEEDIHTTGTLLHLEILGYENRNFREEIRLLISENPFVTAEQLSKQTNVGLFVVYSVAKRLGHKFQNAYSIRRAEAFAKIFICHQLGTRKDNSRMQILAHRIQNN